MKKAFTLIELIATIVILGVVTSIVSILIMNVIRNVKDSANKRSIDNYGRIADTAMSEYQSQYLKYPDSIDQLEIEYVGSVIECETRRINPDKTIYLSECKVNGKKVLDKSTEDGYYHYGTLVLTNEEYVDKLGKNIEVALKDYYEENNKYPVNYRLLNLPTLDKDVNCVSEIHPDGTVYLTKCSIDGSYILNENEEDGYYHYGKTMYDYFDNDGNGYIEVEYLESTGTQYIDTGIYPKSTTRVVFNFELKEGGCYNGWGSSGGAESYMWGANGNGQYQSLVSNNWTSSNTEILVDGKRHEFDLSSGHQKFDDVEYGTTQIGDTATTNQTLYLFATRVEWTWEPNYWCKEKVFSVKIYDGNRIMRDYIPMLDKNNRPCLFDKVQMKCYYNQGTGEFLYG